MTPAICLFLLLPAAAGAQEQALSTAAASGAYDLSVSRQPGTMDLPPAAPVAALTLPAAAAGVIPAEEEERAAHFCNTLPDLLKPPKEDPKKLKPVKSVYRSVPFKEREQQAAYKEAKALQLCDLAGAHRLKAAESAGKAASDPANKAAIAMRGNLTRSADLAENMARSLYLDAAELRAVNAGEK